MASIDWIAFWLLGFALGGRGFAMVDHQNHVQFQCSFTRYPHLCVQTLMDSNHSSVDMMMSGLVNKTIAEINLRTSFFRTSSSQFEMQDANLRDQSFNIGEYCEELMKKSLKLLDKSLLALKDSPTKNKHDIQTWLSASLTLQQECKDSSAGTHVSSKMDYLSALVSNPLALVNRITSNSKIPPIHNKRSKKFPSWVYTKERKLLQSSEVNADVVVAKDGTGNYKTVSEAVEAASGGKRFVIHVKAGVYKEKVQIKKDGITLIGDGKYSTIIVGDDSVFGRSSMPGSATVTITGDGFIARDIGFQNTAGPQGEQALALYVASDHAVFFRCSIAGYQDTLFALALRQFYRECDIYGTIDFIFGNAAAVFQNCNLGLRKPGKNQYNVILANGRTDPGQNTGFSLQNCRITASSDFSPVRHSVESYLGRPWKEYSRSVVMQTYIDDFITGKGWVAWPGAGSYAKTLYFGEYKNTGPGAGTSGRVNWPTVRVLGPEDAVKFTVGNLIAGTSWLPSTGVAFISGL